MQFLEMTDPKAVARTRLHAAPWDRAWDLPEAPEPRLHRIHTYPAKFPAFLTERALAYTRSEGVDVQRIADVFCGCGTVAFEARRAGLGFWGCDINPVATLIAQTKSAGINPRTFRARGRLIAESFAKAPHAHSLAKPAVDRLRRWYAPKAFHDLARLRNAILANASARSTYRPALLCAFSAILKGCSRWRQRSIKPALDPGKRGSDVREAFLSQIETMAAAFEEAGRLKGPSPQIHNASVLTIDPPDALVDLIVTSPPYGTSYDYADLHQLSSLWLGLTDDHRRLRVGSIGTSQHTLDLRRAHADLNTTARQVVFSLYPVDPSAAAAVANYYLDMQRVAGRCKEFLKADGCAVFVIGNTRYHDVEVDNASHLAEALLHAGFSKVFASRRRISNKCATPFRNREGRYTRDHTSPALYAEEFILIARL